MTITGGPGGPGGPAGTVGTGTADPTDPTGTPPPPPRRTQGLSWTADGRVVPSVRRRLAPLVSRDRRLDGWLATLGVTALAAFLRFWRLGYPHEFLFDETYYAKDAYGLLQFGYTRQYVEGADEKILAGDLSGLTEADPSMVVHPEAGKWLIAAGEWLFGMEPLGWRFASAVAGALMVMVMVRLVRRLTGSTLLGVVAGLLLCFDGLHFVMSRLALLDVFMALFLLSAVACLVTDRDWGRLRLARAVPSGWRATRADWGPVRPLRLRPWRLAAGALFGLALAVKWNALFPMAGFGLWVYLEDAGSRRALGVRTAYLRSAVVDGIPAFLSLVGVAVVVYVSTWGGWLANAEEYERTLSDTQYGAWGDYYQEQPATPVGELAQDLRSLWNYHQIVYTFHTEFLDDADHVYQSQPVGWPLLNRPVGVDADLDIKPGEQGCDAPADSTCLRQVILLGTPVLWWGGALALLYAVYAWARGDWRFGVPVVGFLWTWLPWLRYDDRPIFSYYAVAMVPFTVIAVTLVMGTLMGGPRASERRRAWGTALSGAFLALVIANFAWFWPIYTDALITTPDWLDRIWFRSWI